MIFFQSLVTLLLMSIVGLVIAAIAGVTPIVIGLGVLAGICVVIASLFFIWTV